MDKINKYWPIILGIGVILIVLMLYQFLKIRLEAPDFAAIQDVKERQKTFFDYFARTTQQVNKSVMGDRKKFEKLAANPNNLSTKAGWLKARAALYGVKGDISPAFFEELFRRVDVVPPALILPQAALESGWGTSRFASEGNNFLGQKCFHKGCGMVPKDRSPGQTFEMATFDTPYDSVNEYMWNINTHDAYAPLRDIRAQLRKSGRPITGMALAEGLKAYAENGTDYIRDIQALIKAHRLDETYGLLPER
jgi:Bax protein